MEHMHDKWWWMDAQGNWHIMRSSSADPESPPPTEFMHGKWWWQDTKGKWRYFN
jgi:hypothetical protein